MDPTAPASIPQPLPVPRLRATPRPQGDEAGATAVIQRVACRLRTARRERGMTLEEVSAASGVSRTALSQIERQRCNPSLDSLWRIAAGLGLAFSELLDPPKVDIVVVRASAALCDRAKKSQSSRLLVPVATTPWGEVREFTLAAGSVELIAAHPPGTRELIVVLEGELRILLGRSRCDLGVGDSLVSFADTRRGYQNIGSEAVRFHVFVLSPR